MWQQQQLRKCCANAAQVLHKCAQMPRKCRANTVQMPRKCRANAAQVLHKCAQMPRK
jgi:hypothetical protein